MICSTQPDHEYVQQSKHNLLYKPLKQNYYSQLHFKESIYFLLCCSSFQRTETVLDH